MEYLILVLDGLAIATAVFVGTLLNRHLKKEGAPFSAQVFQLTGHEMLRMSTRESAFS